MTKILIVLPTLNEKKNIKKVYDKLKKIKYINFNLLFIDDNSNDGTEKLIKKFCKNKKNFCLLRNKRLGLGKAHMDGILWGYKKKFDFVITMDSDLAHDPKYIKEFFKLKDYHVCIGSRYLKKKSTPKWSLFRVFLSLAAHQTSRILYGFKIDTTNGFRCYNLTKINKKFFKTIKNTDYDFFQTSAVLMLRSNFIIKEFPMKIYGRLAGNSKMNLKHILKSILNMFYLFIKLLIFNLKNSFKLN